MTREESLISDKKLSINFGPSFDPAGVNIVDSVQIYGKSKEAFGWPEDADEFAPNSHSSQTGQVSNSVAETSGNQSENSNLQQIQAQNGPYDKVASVILEILEGCFSIEASPNNIEEHKAVAMDITTKILAINASNSVENSNQTLLSTLFASKNLYHVHKDDTLLTQVASNEKFQKEKDVEKFEKLVLEVRNVAISRPSNLVKFAENQHTNSAEFILKLSKWFWNLMENCPVNHMVGTLGQPGLTSNIDATVQALIEVFHAFTTIDSEVIPQVSNLYAEFLKASNLQVSFAAKQAIIRVLRPRLRRKRVFIPSPPLGEVTLNSLEEPQQPPPPPPPAAEPEAMDVDQEYQDANEGTQN